MIVFIILTLFVNYNNGFNLDIGETIWILPGPNGTNFGHSVLLHQGGDGNRYASFKSLKYLEVTLITNIFHVAYQQTITCSN